MSLLDAFTSVVKALGGITISRRFLWTGYIKPMPSNCSNIFKLLDAIHQAYSRPEYQPKQGMTYCNQFINDVCETLGYHGLDGKLANEIVDLLDSNPEWIALDIASCQKFANNGALIIAGTKADPHGHVNVICPGGEKTSGRWGIVPSCANVGKENFIGRGVNWAFGDYPKFWAWRPTLKQEEASL